jgi:hypothetical protein
MISLLFLNWMLDQTCNAGKLTFSVFEKDFQQMV